MQEDGSVGGTIRAIRRKLRLSQSGFARRAGVSQSVISRIENGVQPVKRKLLDSVAKVISREQYIIVRDAANRDCVERSLRNA